MALNAHGGKIYGALSFYAQQFFEIAFRCRNIHILRQRPSDDRLGWKAVILAHIDGTSAVPLEPIQRKCWRNLPYKFKPFYT